jgi:hypothetical protein
MLGYETERMTDKAKSRTAQRIVDAAAESGFKLDQVDLPGTKGFRYKQSQIEEFIKIHTLTPKAA